VSRVIFFFPIEIKEDNRTDSNSDCVVFFFFEGLQNNLGYSECCFLYYTNMFRLQCTRYNESLLISRITCQISFTA